MLAKNNLKKKDFHEKTGITRAAFSLWKNEKAFPSKESLDIINQFLGTTLGVSEIEKTPTVETNSERQAEAGVRSVKQESCIPNGLRVCVGSELAIKNEL